MKALFLSLLLGMVAGVQAQVVTFQKTIRQPSGMVGVGATVYTVDGGYMTIGGLQIASVGGGFVLLIKTDSMGNREWVTGYQNQASGGSFNHIIQTSDGGYLLTGSRWNPQTAVVDLLALKTDDTGAIIWSHLYGGSVSHESGRYALQTMDGGYMILGTTTGAIFDNAIYLVRTDPAGNVIWTKTYNTWGDVGTFIIARTGNEYVIGGGSSYGGTSDPGGAFLMSIDSMGNPLWTRSYGTSTGLQQWVRAGDGGFLFGGSHTLSSSHSEIYLLKTDSLFNEQWSKSYMLGTSSIDFSYLHPTKDNGCMLAAGSNYLNYADIVLIKTNDTGMVSWAKNIGRGGLDKIYCLRQLADTGYMLIGQTQDTFLSNYTRGAYFIKTDDSGNSCYTQAVEPLVTELPIISDTFSFVIGSQDTFQPVSLIMEPITTLTDSMLCYQTTDPNSIPAAEPVSGELQVYPNPVRTYLYIHSPEPLQAVVLFDLSGRIVYNGGGQSAIHLAHLTPGLYFYRIRHGRRIEHGKIQVH